MAKILIFSRKQPVYSESSTLNDCDADVSQTAKIEDLECGPWTTRKLKIPTSSSGYLIIECFESADGKRLKGLGKTEPDFCLSKLKIRVQNSFGFDELILFPYAETAYTDTDFMSYVINYPKHGRLIVMLSLLLEEKIIQCKLWF
jgi:hypothetical protein